MPRRTKAEINQVKAVIGANAISMLGIIANRLHSYCMMYDMGVGSELYSMYKDIENTHKEYRRKFEKGSLD